MSDQGYLSEEPVQLGPLVKACLMLLQRYRREPGIDVSTQQDLTNILERMQSTFESVPTPEGNEDALRSRLHFETAERLAMEEDLRNATHGLSKERETLEARVAARTAELKARNQELEAVVRQNQLALEASGGGFWRWQAETGEYTFSPQLANLAELKEQATLNFEAWSRLVHPDDRSNLRLSSLFEGRHRLSVCHYRIITATGRERLVQSNQRAVYDEGSKLVEVHGFIFDVSSLHQVQRSLMVQGLASERLLTQLNTLIRLASHDLQEPLRLVQMYASMLDGEQDEAQADAHIRFKLIKSVERMRAQIADMQKYAEFARTTHPTKEPIRLKELVQEVIFELQDKNPGLQLQVDCSASAKVHANRRLILELFRRVLENTVAYGSYPTYSIKIIHREEGETTFVDIQDDGPGIPPGAHELVFEPHRRLHPGLSPTGGTGIGLSLCRLIAECHGGWIRINGEKPEPGTKVTLQLPQAPNPRERLG